MQSTERCAGAAEKAGAQGEEGAGGEGLFKCAQACVCQGVK